MSRKNKTIAIIGLGWSGSGALIDLCQKTGNFASFPYEMDFWRRPKGLYSIKDKQNFKKIILKELSFTIIIIIKSFFKFFIKPFNFLENMKNVINHSKLSLVFLISFFSSFLFSSPEKDKVFFIKFFKFIFGNTKKHLIFDQPLFIEQIEDDKLGFLEVDFSFVVVRNVYDQVMDILNHSNYLDITTIKEAFYMGPEGDLKNNVTSIQMETILKTLKRRILLLKNLVIKHSDKFMIICFEDLIMDTDKTKEKINVFAKKNGCDDALIQSKIGNVLKNSHKNINIGEELKNSDISTLLHELECEVTNIKNLSSKKSKL